MEGIWPELRGYNTLLFTRIAKGFLMTTMSQDLGLTSHPKDDLLTVLCPHHYTEALGPTQTTG